MPETDKLIVITEIRCRKNTVCENPFSNTGKSVLKSKGFYRTGSHLTGLVRRYFVFTDYLSIGITCNIFQSFSLNNSRLFEIRRTKWAENHKDRQYCQVCRSGCPTKFFVCVFCFAPEIGNATDMPERSRSTRN